MTEENPPNIAGEPDGSSPLDSDEMAGLFFKHVTTRGELDQLEQANIDEGMQWLKKQKTPDVLTEGFTCDLHKQLFGKVWKWAGSFRKTEKNIGIDPVEVAIQLRQLLDDARYWIDSNTYPPKELAARFHHKLVYIHPFPNGNGRHARIMADALLTKLMSEEEIDWAGGFVLEKMNVRRDQYIAALRSADGHEFDALFEFVGASDGNSRKIPDASGGDVKYAVEVKPIMGTNKDSKVSEVSKLSNEINKRRTFAIISHPDAGKTTITEKLLLLGQLIQVAGSVKGKKADRHATSDWMGMEKERGISVTSSVMQFPYHDCMVNLLDTPGHEDFSEDTYRTLTAVDSALMVIDGAKGVEDRTIKLMKVCRLRDTPIIGFVNKMDRDIRDPIDLLDEVEEVLKIAAAPINWPIGMGKEFKGVYNLYTDTIHLFQQGKNFVLTDDIQINGLQSDEAKALLGVYYDDYVEEVELVRGASHDWDQQAYLDGKLSPVFFGSAMANFGIREMLDDFVKWAPSPLPRPTETREVSPTEENFSGFVFKIQANMDPKHRDRIAFMRICSGEYNKGMKMRHVRLAKDVKIADAVSFKAGERELLEGAVSGDIIGLHNHGTIQIGDAFTAGENLKFTGIPHFAPEMFRRIRLKDPLKTKQLQKGLQQLSEEGSTQVFFPLNTNDIVVGAVGVLQFEVVAYRLKDEYKVDAIYESVAVNTARWVDTDDTKKLEEFKRKCADNLALDGGGHLTYLAPTRVNLSLSIERYPEVEFRATREH